MDVVLDAFWADLFGVEAASGHIYEFVEKILINMRLVAGVIATTYMGYKVMLYFSDIETKLDPSVIIKPLMILGIMSLYSDLVDLLIRWPMEIIDLIIDQGVTGISWPTPTVDPGVPVGTIQERFEAVMTYVDLAASPGLGIYDILAINPTLELIHLLIYLTALVVGYYMLFRQIVLIAIYYITGTIALPFSLIAGNQATAGNWYFGFISIMMWKPMLKIMQVIIISLDPTDKTWDNALFPVALQIVMIITILQIPKFANLVVSKGSELGQDVGKNVRSNMSKMLK